MQATDKLAEAAESLLTPIEAETEEAEVDQEEPEEAEADEVEAEAEDAEAEEDASPEDEDETDDAGQRQPERLKVKVDGQDVEVTLEDLKRSYSGQAYIQKQMQEVAATRKQAQQELQALQAEQEKFVAFAQAVQQQGFRSQPTPPDPSLAATDPLGYVQEEARYNAEMRQFQAQQAQLQHMQMQAAEQRKRATIEMLQEQSRIVAEAIPEFADPVKGNEIRKRLSDYGVASGYSPEEIAEIMDARAIKVLNKARLWDELQANKAKVKKEPPKNVKPAARRAEPEQLVRRKKLDQAKKSGNLSDFAALILK